MLNKIKKAIIPHIIGILLIVLGWMLCILNVGIDRFSAKGVFNKWTFLGLLIIFCGAYIPEVWIGIRNLFDKKKENIDKKL